MVTANNGRSGSAAAGSNGTPTAAGVGAGAGGGRRLHQQQQQQRSSPPPPDDSGLAEAYRAIKLALGAFGRRAPAAADVPGRAALVAAAERVKQDAAKVGLMCASDDGGSGGAPAPALPPDQLRGLAGALQRSAAEFCALCHARTAAAGPTLEEQLRGLARGVATPCLALIKAMEGGGGGDLRRHVGVVWDGADAVGKAPLDNKGCLFRGLGAALAVLLDAQREMQELEQEQQEEQDGDEAPSSGDGGGEGSGDLDYDGGAMSAAERAALAGCLRLLRAAAAALKDLGRALLRGPPLLPADAPAPAAAAGDDGGSDDGGGGAGDDDDPLQAWESCLFHARHLRRAAEDLGASLYPPQDPAEVASAALAVFEVAELMLDEAPDAERVGAARLAELAAELNAAHEEVTRALDAAAGAEAEAEAGEGGGGGGGAR